jgi:hypothetical protein
VLDFPVYVYSECESDIYNSLSISTAENWSAHLHFQSVRPCIFVVIPSKKYIFLLIPGLRKAIRPDLEKILLFSLSIFLKIPRVEGRNRQIFVDKNSWKPILLHVSNARKLTQLKVTDVHDI